MRIKTRNVGVRVRRSVRAISPVISVLMMIAIAVAASLVAYAWVMGYIGGTTNKVGKAVLIQSVAPDADGNLMVYAQNVGQSAVDLDPVGCVYVNNGLGTVTAFDDGSPAGLFNLLVGHTVQISVDFAFEDVNRVKVVSADGVSTEKLNIQTSTGSGGGGVVPGETEVDVTFEAGGSGTGTVDPFGTATYTVGQSITIDATATGGSTFAGWSTNPATGVASFTDAGAASTTITIEGAGTVTATFNSPPVTIERSPTDDYDSGWSNEDNAYANGGSVGSSNDNGEWCIFRGYGFTIPADATVTQVRVRLDAYRGYGDNDDMRLQVSADGGSTWLIITYLYDLPSSDQNNNYVDVTGWTAWTPDNINSNNIQVRVTHVQSGYGDENIYLDWIPIEVTYIP